jgi:hypothetical protein
MTVPISRPAEHSVRPGRLWWLPPGEFGNGHSVCRPGGRGSGRRPRLAGRRGPCGFPGGPGAPLPSGNNSRADGHGAGRRGGSTRALGARGAAAPAVPALDAAVVGTSRVYLGVHWPATWSRAGCSPRDGCA